MKSVLELADSRLEWARSRADSNAGPPKIGVWIQALRFFWDCSLHFVHQRTN